MSKAEYDFYTHVEKQVNPKRVKEATILEILNLKGIHDIEHPQLSIPFIDWFCSYDFSDFNFIEFGSGFSTNFFAAKVKNLTTFETDPEYNNYIIQTKLDNVSLIFKPKEDIENGVFDITIDDKTILFLDSSTNRYLTIQHILKFGKPNILILDNSEWFLNTSKYIYDNGYSEIPFWGIRPTNDEHIDKCVSVFIKNGYQLPPKNQNFFPFGTYKLDHEHPGDINEI